MSNQITIRELFNKLAEKYQLQWIDGQQGSNGLLPAISITDALH